ncbi:MAG: peptidoglycan-associated lipoprotein Pal [Parvularculaceae bacterium]|jgi:peptidoglycan-associated lipoprotein|nr:peptidoglycan-associated lipoprotein Pal [Parvularculaceae bacterium]
MNFSAVFKAAGVAGLVLLAACASSKGPDVVANGDTGSTGGTRGSAAAPGSQEDLEQNAGHRVFFGYNEYTLTPQAQATLARQAAWLKQYPNVRIMLAGNCDERGTREYNLALGARRAEAARAYLVSLGVDGSRVQTVSYGKERPLDTRSTEDAWSVNRNATTTITSVGS